MRLSIYLPSLARNPPLGVEVPQVVQRLVLHLQLLCVLCVQTNQASDDSGYLALYASDDSMHLTNKNGLVRLQGIAVPVGTTRTCLPDSVWSALIALYQHLKLDLETVRRAIPELVTADPNSTRAQTFVSGYGAELVYERQINSPRDLFIRREGVYLVQLDITTADQTDKHYVTYLAATGHVIDNYPRAPVPVIAETDRHNATKRRSKSSSSCSQVLKECS